jgi:hypothetical protein
MAQKEATVAYPTYYSVIPLEALRKNRKNSLANVAGVLTDISGKNPPIKNPELYRYISLLDFFFFFIVCQS